MEDTKFYKNKENLEHGESWGGGVGEIVLTEVSFFFCLGKCVTISTCLILIYIKNCMIIHMFDHYYNDQTHTFDHYSQILYL